MRGVALVAIWAAACTRPNYVPCETSADCTYLDGGVCRINGQTGNRWCSGLDGTCPSSFRWSEVTGDELSSVCVEGSEPLCDRPLTWVSTRFGDREILIANPDGSQENLTLDDVDNGDHEWSPSGDRLAYLKASGTTSEIWILEPDGSSRPVTVGYVDASPRWSPDGAQIAFVRQRTGGSDLWVASSTLGAPVQVSLDPTTADHSPAWSPDGSRLAFFSTMAAADNLYTMASNGTDRLQLTMDTFTGVNGHGDRPQWAPDGQQILYVSSRTGDTEIWAYDGGGNQINYSTSSTTSDESPRWSADGARIFFVRSSTAGTDAYSMRSDGQDQSPLGVLGDGDTEFALSRDGRSIAWTSTRDGNPEIYTASAAGGVVTRVTSDAGDDRKAAWRRCR